MMTRVRPGRDAFGRAALCAVVAGLTAWTPVRSEEAATKPVVPEDQAKLGRVYYLVPTKKPQVTFRSRTSVQKFRGKSVSLVGYVVAPTGGDVPPAKLAAGKFQLPVLTLDTGNPQMNEHMRAKRWLKAADFPEIAFTLSHVDHVKLVREKNGTAIYRAKLVGTMSIVGQDKEMTVGARVTLKPQSDRTRRIAPGDLMTIKSKFDVTLADFGLGIGDPSIEQKKIAETMKIDLNLTLSTEPPSGESS